MHFVEADEFKALMPKLGYQRVEELRRDLERPVGLESACARWPHMMQRQDDANSPAACERRL
jgi:hypothetical protein